MRKCQPRKSPYYKRDFNICTGPTQFDPLFMDNVHDLSDTLVKIITVFGIHQCKAKAVRSLIVKAFQFYDVKRHRFTLRPEDEGSLTKCQIVRDFERRGMMTYVEALLCYQLLKRAIKAFFLHTPDHSIRSPITEAIVLKEQEYTWKHAAHKSILVFESYEGAFFNAAPNYKQQIVQLYNDLHERFKRRAEPIIVEDYQPRGCHKRIIVGTVPAPKLDSEKQVCVQQCKRTNELRDYLKSLPPKKFPIEECLSLPTPCNVLGLQCNPPAKPKSRPSDKDIVPRKVAKKPKNTDLNLPRCYQCNCPQIMCDCDIDPNTGIVAIDCSQGPFECQWVRMEKGDRLDPCIKKPELHICPIDCLIVDTSSSDSDDCGYCKCSSEEDTEYTSEGERKDDNDLDSENASDYDEEKLESMMKKNMPKRMGASERKSRCDDCAIRQISKIPPLMITSSKD